MGPRILEQLGNCQWVLDANTVTFIFCGGYGLEARKGNR